MGYVKERLHIGCEAAEHTLLLFSLGGKQLVLGNTHLKETVHDLYQWLIYFIWDHC